MYYLLEDILRKKLMIFCLVLKTDEHFSGLNDFLVLKLYLLELFRKYKFYYVTSPSADMVLKFKSHKKKSKDV